MLYSGNGHVGIYCILFILYSKFFTCNKIFRIKHPSMYTDNSMAKIWEGQVGGRRESMCGGESTHL